MMDRKRIKPNCGRDWNFSSFQQMVTLFIISMIVLLLLTRSLSINMTRHSTSKYIESDENAAAVHFESNSIKTTHLSNRTLDDSVQKKGQDGNFTEFVVNTQFCKIPNIDPYNPMVLPFLKNVSLLECSVKYDIVYSKGNKVYINWTEVERSSLKGIMEYCRYDVIRRPKNHRHQHNYYEYLSMEVNFYSFIQIDHDYIRVQCFSSNKSVVYTNFFSFMHDDFQAKDDGDNSFNIHRQSVDETLSVLMLGIDSISRLNMIRTMNRTRSVLLERFSAIELKGYNKIGENTFPNVASMVSGQFKTDLYNKSSKDTSFDKINFIWNDFWRAGFTTMYSEDDPYIATFDYLKDGFKYFPTDVFNRHFSLAIEDTNEIWNTDHLCVHARPEQLIHLDHVRQFITKSHGKPYFAFNFITRVTHDYMTKAHMLDQLYADYFESLYQRNLLNNTVVIFFSDHGMRFGEFTETPMGRLEERLPFIYLIFPKWFLKKYPKIKYNMDVNTNRLTSPFDVYATLVHILNFKATGTDSSFLRRGTSLLQEISDKRTCADASISPHWCTCHEQKNMTVSNKSVIMLANFLTSHINDLLKDVADVCENLTLAEIKSAVLLKPVTKNRKQNVSSSDREATFTEFRITIRTMPGNAVFEGSLQVNFAENSLIIADDISRLNMYKNQSHCVRDRNLKDFCYCKKQV